MRVVKPYTPMTVKRMKFGTFDIETRGLGATPSNFIFGYVYVDGAFHYFEDPNEMFYFMKRKKYVGYKFFAHNAIYDLQGIMGQVLDQGIFINSGNRVIMLKVPVGKRQYVTFVDSMVFWNMSLEKVGKAVGLTKLELGAGTEEGQEEIINKTEKAKEYCRRDCEIVYRAIKLCEDTILAEGVELGYTIASTALKVWRHLLKENIYIDEKDDEFINAYYGGRVEVFRKELVNGYYYDFNSLYPSVMAEGNYPDPSYMRETSGKENLMKVLNDYEGFAEVVFEVPDTLLIPPLPVRMENKLIFPVGVIRGSWCFPEIRLALKMGCRILKVPKIIYAQRRESPFKDFVTRFYKKRQELKAQGNPQEYVIKILLNSLYGKFGQRNKGIFGRYDIPPGENYEFVPRDADGIYGTWVAVGEEEYEEFAKHDIISWAAYVTSYGRVKLYNAILKAGMEHVYYCDTDSLFTDVPLESSNELGELKDELGGKTTNAKFCRPKFYEYTDQNNNLVKKGKGVKRSILEGLVFGGEEPTEVKFESIMGPVLSLIRKKPNGEHYMPGEVYITKRTISWDDEKRVWNGNKSKPIKLYMN